MPPAASWKEKQGVSVALYKNYGQDPPLRCFHKCVSWPPLLFAAFGVLLIELLRAAAQGNMSTQGPQTKLLKPKTHKGRRELEKRAPKLVRSAVASGVWPTTCMQCNAWRAAAGGSGPGTLRHCVAQPASVHYLQVEDPKRALVLYGHKTSQVIKDVLTDIHKLKGVSRGHSCTLHRGCSALCGFLRRTCASWLSLHHCTTAWQLPVCCESVCLRTRESHADPPVALDAADQPSPPLLPR